MSVNCLLIVCQKEVHVELPRMGHLRIMFGIVSCQRVPFFRQDLSSRWQKLKSTIKQVQSCPCPKKGAPARAARLAPPWNVTKWNGHGRFTVTSAFALQTALGKQRHSRETREFRKPLAVSLVNHSQLPNPLVSRLSFGHFRNLNSSFRLLPTDRETYPLHIFRWIWPRQEKWEKRVAQKWPHLRAPVEPALSGSDFALPFLGRFRGQKSM